MKILFGKFQETLIWKIYLGRMLNKSNFKKCKQKNKELMNQIWNNDELFI